jgi:hypothetical protein
MKLNKGYVLSYFSCKKIIRLADSRFETQV